MAYTMEARVPTGCFNRFPLLLDEGRKHSVLVSHCADVCKTESQGFQNAVCIKKAFRTPKPFRASHPDAAPETCSPLLTRPRSSLMFPFCSSPESRGGSRSSRTRAGMRWTLGCRSTSGMLAYGEIVWSWRPKALASSSRATPKVARGRRWQTRGFTEEITYKP